MCVCRGRERFVCRGTGRGLFVVDRERFVCRGTGRGVCVGGQGEVCVGPGGTRRGCVLSLIFPRSGSMCACIQSGHFSYKCIGPADQTSHIRDAGISSRRPVSHTYVWEYLACETTCRTRTKDFKS